MWRPPDTDSFENVKSRFMSGLTDTFRKYFLGDAFFKNPLDPVSKNLLGLGADIIDYQVKKDEIKARSDFKPNFLDRLIPSHGNFAGPSYSGGIYTDKYNRNWLEQQGTDLVDEASRLHDIAYSVAKNKNDLVQIDKIYLKNLKEIYDKIPEYDYKQKSYAEKAIQLFDLKIKSGVGYNEPSKKITPQDRLEAIRYLKNMKNYKDNYTNIFDDQIESLEAQTRKIEVSEDDKFDIDYNEKDEQTIYSSVEPKPEVKPEVEPEESQPEEPEVKPEVELELDPDLDLSKFKNNLSFISLLNLSGLI